MTPSPTPVRGLYRLLCRLDAPDQLHMNLEFSHPDYAAMRGDPEPRFCEWVYHRLEERRLVDGLSPGVLRPTDVMKLAALAGCEKATRDLDVRSQLRLALAHLGVVEPGSPPPVADGGGPLRLAHHWLDEQLRAAPGRQAEPADDMLGPDGACRRNAERLLKVLVLFYWDSGYDDLIRRVVTEGLGGFKKRAAEDDWVKWLLSGWDLGSFNFLLRALSKQVEADGTLPRFVRDGGRLWEGQAFGAIDGLAKALQAVAHDKLAPDRQRRADLFDALGKVLGLVDGEVIRLPRVIQFFRRYDDGQVSHYEGYNQDGERIRCYECTHDYKLHQPYLFLSATNPSALDPVCIPLRPEFHEAGGGKP